MPRCAARGWASTSSSCTARTAICLQPVPVAAQQPAQRRVRRHRRQAPALPARGLRGLPPGLAGRQGDGHAALLRRMGRGRRHASRTRSRPPASSRRWAAISSMPARAATPRPRRSRSSRATTSSSPPASARKPASRPGRSASSPSPSRPKRIIASGQADCTAHARAFLLDPRWGWNAARALGVETPPLPLPAVRATTILPFKPQPILARAAE